MCSVMAAHVDDLASLAHGAESSLADRFGSTYEGHYRAVGSLARVHIEQFHALYAFHSVSNLPDNVHVAPLTEIRDAFHDSLVVVHK